MIPSKRAHLHVAAISHAGMKGKNNEDRYGISSYLFDEEDAMPILFAIVSDGIGGHRAGEVAAEMVVDYVSDAVAESSAQQPQKILTQAVAGANQAVLSKSEEDDDTLGMGATCSCAWVIGDRLYTGTVGDSRIYLMRGANIQQVSIDHTWIQEAIEKGIISPEQARDHPNAHVIRRYVGGKDAPEVDFRMRLEPKESDERAEANQGLKLKPGDSVLLCSDGLTDLVWNDEILEMVRSTKDLNVAIQKLVDLANERGGHDNITIVLLSMPKNGALKTTPKIALPWLIGGAIAFLLAAAALVGFIWYATQPPVVTLTPTLAATPTITATIIPDTPTFIPTFTSTPRPTVGPTYTPWPTSTPE